ncbi:uncharacterized protein [Spinacia oleracea]|uniref:RNase H type-1 domain-containing protein n=1 Tax=Spinacia oleracea TaxID=3562 RepID=A0ABM3RRK3_SPIOL|nr:uncharacterized protein LOC130471915 [Spinacia oleracea]
MSEEKWVAAHKHYSGTIYGLEHHLSNRTLRPQDRQEKEILSSILDRVTLSHDGIDQYIWMPDKRGTFSVKSFGLELAKRTNMSNLPTFKGLWAGLIPFRIEMFSWFALLGKLNTKSKLINLGLIPPSESLCVLCESYQECHNHLLLQCDFADTLWKWWLNLWGIKWVLPSTIKLAYEQWQHPNHGNFFKKVWKAAFFIIIWSIWKERNMRIFEQKASPPCDIQNLILLRISWWIKGWGDPFPYCSDDILRNPQCLKWRGITTKLFRPEHKQCDWLPPPNGSLKWNVDASLKTSLPKSAIGGVLRDINGNFRCLFSTPIPTMEINNAEVLAIHRAIKISKGSDRLSQCKLTIESDSANAVKWCNESNGGPWNLNFILNFIRNSSKEGLGIEIIYKGRESNFVADSLAKQGLVKEDEFLAWM